MCIRDSSGNSPESLAAVAVAKELVHNVKFLNITCAPEGKLAVESADDPNALTLLIPRANDKGFAMTGSYSCMTLLSTLIFDTASDEQKAEMCIRDRPRTRASPSLPRR